MSKRVLTATALLLLAPLSFAHEPGPGDVTLYRSVSDDANEAERDGQQHDRRLAETVELQHENPEDHDDGDQHAELEITKVLVAFFVFTCELGLRAFGWRTDLADECHVVAGNGPETQVGERLISEHRKHIVRLGVGAANVAARHDRTLFVVSVDGVNADGAT